MGNTAEKIKKVRLDSFSEDQYYGFGVYVNEDRAIPSGVDGLKPVARRLLWAAYKAGITTKVKKSARIVGDTIGKYHPHGDSAAYESLVNMANSPVPLFTGEGNFGSFSDPSFAAMRYTNARISNFGNNIFFDPFYLPVVDMVPNFDDEEVEPVILPALLPNAIINGTQGIGVGLATCIPAFSAKSVVKLLREVFEGAELTSKLCVSRLELVTKYGATYDKKESRAALKSLMQTGKGRIVFKPVYTVDPKKKTLTVTGFAQSSMEKSIEKVMNLKGLRQDRIIDASKAKGKVTALYMEFMKSASNAEIAAVTSKVEEALSSATSFDIKITKRVKKGDKVETSLHNVSVVALLKNWIEFRIDLEKKATAYWIEKTDGQIRYNELLRLAIANLDNLIKALRQKHSSREELNKSVAKLLKIELKEADIITGLQVYRLSSLEDAKIVEKIKELKARKNELQERNKKPEPYIAKTLGEFKV